MDLFDYYLEGSSYVITGIKNKSVTSIVVPDCVKKIESGAFSGCSSLESITLPFVGCDVHVGDDHIEYGFGYIFGSSKYSGGKLISQRKYINGSQETISGWITKPNGTKEHITETVPHYYYIPNNLRNVVVTGGSIPSGAFYDCSSLTSITLGNSVTSIGSSAFYNCSSLTSITIPNSVKCIGYSAFNGCSSLVSITLPFVGDKAHTSTDKYQYPFGYIFGTSSYTGGTATTQYYYRSSTSSTTNTTYYIPTSLREVIITGSSYIQYGAFYNCSMLTSVEILGSVTSIGSSAFYNCSNLISIVIPNSVTSIGNYTFDSCSNLTSVYYKGEQIKWQAISIDSNNTYLTDAERYYYSENSPTESGNYWHYDNKNNIVEW